MSGVGTQPAGLGQARVGSWELRFIRHVTSGNLHGPMVLLRHREDTIYGISKLKENDMVKTTDEGVMEKDF